LSFIRHLVKLETISTVEKSCIRGSNKRRKRVNKTSIC
jgi:hypothetical protein